MTINSVAAISAVSAPARTNQEYQVTLRCLTTGPLPSYTSGPARDITPPPVAANSPLCLSFQFPGFCWRPGLSGLMGGGYYRNTGKIRRPASDYLISAPSGSYPRRAERWRPGTTSVGWWADCLDQLGGLGG